MRRRFYALIIITTLLANTLVLINYIPSAKANTITVPDDYATIQAAINAANPGDMIYVKSGTYFEQLNVNKTVRLVGENPETTIIASEVSEIVISIEADGVEVENLTVRAVRLWADLYPVAIHVSSASNCSIANNRLISSTTGLWLEHANNSLVCNNSLEDNEHGMTLTYSDCNDVQENRFRNDSAAIWVWCYSSNNSIHDNDIKNSSGFGVLVMNSSNWNNIYRNDVSYTGEGVDVFISSYNRVYENSVMNCSWGISLGFASYNMFYKNTIAGSENGLSMIDVSYNEFCFNNVTGNAVGFWGQGFNIRNSVHHNNFISNEQQSQFDSLMKTFPNYLDNGYPSGGNYWSDYNGTDEYNGPFQNGTGSDGIGDTPYTISEVNTDHYPLMSPVNLFEATTPELTPAEIELVSNSTISNFEVNMTNGAICFEVSGETGIGYCRLTIPNTIVYGLWGGKFTVAVDGIALGRVERWADSTGTYVYFKYNHSRHEVKINPQPLPWDVNRDGYVGIDDIFSVATRFGLTSTDPDYNSVYDMNDDGYVGIDDIFAVAQHFGEENP